MSEIVDSPPLASAANAESGTVGGSDAARLAQESPTRCLNCGAILPGEFCPDCGQRDQPVRQPAHVFIAESVSEYFGLDGRLWRSLGLLLFRPGALTEAYLDGRRTRYLRPLRLYLTASISFFFLLSLLDPFEGSRRVIVLQPIASDTTLSAGALDQRLEDRRDVAQVERDALLSAAALVGGLARGDSLRAAAARLDTLAGYFNAWEDRIDGLAASTPVAIDTLTPRVVAALADTGRAETIEAVNQIVGDGIPEWAKGDLARQLQESESPVERRVLLAQYQRAVLRQVPTALFLVLPLFAVLLKLFYIRGAGRTPRLRRRPRPVPADAPWTRRLGYRADVLAWAVRRWRARRRVRSRRKAYLKAQRRPIRGALRRARSWLAAHPALRPWRLWQIRRFRRSLAAHRTMFYAEHLVFALHVHAFTFFVLTLLIGTGLNGGDLSNGLNGMSAVLAATIPLYFVLAQKRVYAEGWPATLAKASAIGFVYILLISAGTVFAAGLALRLS